MLADKIEANAGYSSGYHDHFAIEYSVGLWNVDLGKDHIFEVACEEHGAVPPLTGLEWDENQVYYMAQERMCQGLNDDDGQRSYSPKTAIKYGLPYHRFPLKYVRKSNECAYYPAKKGGWILEDPYCCEYFDVTFGLYGRGGKHLCVEEFEGHKLNRRNEDLVEELRTPCAWDQGGYSNKWCVKLLAMMEEWETLFTTQNASKEMEYQVAFYMHQDQTEKAKVWRKALAHARVTHRAFKDLEKVQFNLVNPSLPGFEVRA